LILSLEGRYLSGAIRTSSPTRPKRESRTAPRIVTPLFSSQRLSRRRHLSLTRFLLGHSVGWALALMSYWRDLTVAEVVQHFGCQEVALALDCIAYG
jgi:hypothetical protein